MCPTQVTGRSRWVLITTSSRSIARSRLTRELAFGKHLDIPAGTAVRFEPGDNREVELVAFGGERDVHGLNRLTEGGDVQDALGRARAASYEGA